jgi:hypothetical protein
MTKHLKPALILTFGLLALGASTGCISHTETSYTEPTRDKVSFATEKAGRVFYEALQRTPESRRRTVSRTDVNLILIEVEHRKVTGPNAIFNKAVAFADTDHNGEITETEAEIFARAWTRDDD